MITATTWVPRGFAAQFPQRYDIDEKEFARIADLARLHLEDAREDLAEAEAADSDDGKEEKKGKKSGESGGVVGETVDKDEDMKEVGDEKDDDDLREYDLDNYDEPTEEEGVDGESMGMFGNIKGLAYYQPGEQDPYITMDPGGDDEEEREELQVLGTDNLLLVAKTEDDIAHLEVYVYEDEADNLYVHHDIMLPAIPLCVEWLDIPVGDTTTTVVNKDARGNYAAIGTMDPEIEIWNLDLVDCLFPNAILGAGSEPSPTSVSKSKKKNKKKKTPKANDNYHIDAVLSLSGNRQHRNLLASASADKTVKLWDLSTTKCAKSYNSLHTDKVCALSWHPSSATTILSGSYDRTIAWSDMRAPDSSSIPRWGVDADVEDVRWDPHDDHYFYASTESGNLYLYDSRHPPPASSLSQSKPVWTLKAHDKSLSAFDVNPVIPGFIVTASVDKSVKLWNTQAENAGGGPAMVVSRDFDLGKVFSARFAPDKEVGFRLAVAGSKGIVKVWDTSTNAGVRRAFAGRVAGAVVAGEEKEEGVVGAAEDSSDGSEEEDGDEEEDGFEINLDEPRDDGGPDGWESMEEE
ncbi:WD40 repeat-like protein [Choiromyces venosus 120613-1]|uniref:WD40 repeat-like protein n=1 Tax=Choiromyces venosus 120613-1 TaxID=1336337 RepID=A0A3N4JZJ1_9PEZI|nr:WD40 repeat-like protein [Choiromyces venosus 120613-1]